MGIETKTMTEEEKKIIEEFRDKIYGKEDALFDRQGNNVSTSVENFLLSAMQRVRKSDTALILSLQKQVEDLRKNARDYARQDYAKELAEEVAKMSDECGHCYGKIVQIDEILSLLTKEQKINK